MDVTDKLGEWYRLAKITTDAETLKSRLKSIAQLSKATKFNEKIDLIRIFNQNKKESQDTLDNLSSIFLKQDPTFNANDDIEISILAGATLIFSLDNNGSLISNLIAQAVICHDFSDLSPRVPLPDQKNEFKQYLFKQAVLKRNEDLAVSTSKISLDEVHENLVEVLKSNAIDQIKEPLIEYLRAIDSKIDTLDEKLSVEFKKAHAAIKYQREETNILWWLFSEYCNELENPVKNLKQEEACLVIGREIANYPKEIPGPISIEAFLNKMLISCKGANNKKLSIKEAIEGTNRSWREAIYKNFSTDYIDLLPLTFALIRSVETKDDSWIQPFQDETKIDPNKKIEALKLSNQIYNETLFLNEIKKI